MLSNKPDFALDRAECLSPAFQFAQSALAFSQAIIEQALSLGRSLLQMKTDLNCDEYRIFLSQTGWTVAKVNKYIKLAKAFGGFQISQIRGIELTTLFTLCGNGYRNLVARLREMTNITQELVERLMKESRPSQKPKEQTAPVTGWKQNKSGGGRHYNILLHDEQTGIKIEDLAQKQKTLPQTVIIDAVAAWYDLQMPQENSLENQIGFWDWEEVAAVMKRDPNRLLNTVKNWTPEERAELASLLSIYLQENPTALDVETNWVPKKLLEKALSTLSFRLKKIAGPNNLVDEPYLEEIIGCKFVSLKYPGSRYEQWIFRGRDNKLHPVFGRDEFEIQQRQAEIEEAEKAVGEID